MKIEKMILVFLLSALPLLASSESRPEELQGTLKLGYVFTDETGNQGVYQPSYNVYEGLGVSFEDFSYRLQNGTRFSGDFKNVTLNNRHLSAGVAKTGLYNLRLLHSQYRRNYSFDGDKSSRRLNSNGSFWVQVHENIRVFAGYGQISKKGESVELTEPTGFAGINKIDYSQKYFNSGARFSHNRSFLEFDFKSSDFSNELNSADKRDTKRYRFSASAPIPRLSDFYVNGGFQSFNLRMPDRNDTLTSNTGWGGVRYFNNSGYNFKYSFIWDRSRRTTDLAATDNITNAVYAGKEWRNQGGLTLGYRHKINDDFSDGLSTKGYFFSSWLKPHPKVTLRAGYGSEITDVESGATLTGDKDFTRYNASADYKFKQGNWRIKLESKKTENNDIGSSAEFRKVGTDVTVNVDKYGNVMLAYDFLKGDYENVDGLFNFSDHIFWGDFLSRRYKKFQWGAGGTYLRSGRDLDVESFTFRFSGNYSLRPGSQIEIIYTVHNFDDLNDPSPVYSRYYTANIVEINVSRDF